MAVGKEIPEAGERSVLSDGLKLVGGAEGVSCSGICLRGKRGIG